MSRLSKLYDAIETLRKEGVSTDDLEKKVSQAEEDIIKKEILPILTQNIEPALQPVKRELVLVVDYQPGHPISVHLSRKRNFTAEIADAKEIVQDPIVEHGERKTKREEKIERSPASDMTVSFPDGTVIAEKHANDTLEKVVRKIGVARVRQVVETQGLVMCKVPVISNRRDNKYGHTQRDLGNGWLLMTHSNNKMKKAFLEKVSQELDLKLKIVLK